MLKYLLLAGFLFGSTAFAEPKCATEEWQISGAYEGVAVLVCGKTNIYILRSVSSAIKISKKTFDGLKPFLYQENFRGLFEANEIIWYMDVKE